MDRKIVVEKYVSDADGLVAVLYSPGYGAGWSTWNSGELGTEFMMFDQQLVKFALEGADEATVEEYLDKITEHVPYLGGWRDIEIAWMEPGTTFIISEYDGGEGIQLCDEINWWKA